DSCMQDALDIVLQNQQTDGKWLLKHSFNGKFWHDIEQKGKPSKWITLRALRVIKRFSKS
ncbi:MAG: nitrogen fixation protein NifH, partial [Candidatus Thorarchaeota archaeon]